MNTLAARFLLLAGLAQIACFLVLAREIWSRHPVNHVGFDPRVLHAVWGICVLISILALVRRRAVWLAWSCIVLACLLGATLIVVDATNALVQYDVWLKRGMPPSPL